VSDASAAAIGRRKPTGAEWTGIAFVALLFVVNSLGKVALHYVLPAMDANYAAQFAEGLGPLDNYDDYGIHRLVPLAAAVLTLMRHRWAMVSAWVWVGWLVLGIVRGVAEHGPEAIPFIRKDAPGLSVVSAIAYGAFIAAAWYLAVLRRRGVLR